MRLCVFFFSGSHLNIPCPLPSQQVLTGTERWAATTYICHLLQCMTILIDNIVVPWCTTRLLEFGISPPVRTDCAQNSRGVPGYAYGSSWGKKHRLAYLGYETVEIAHLQSDGAKPLMLPYVFLRTSIWKSHWRILVATFDSLGECAHIGCNMIMLGYCLIMLWYKTRL